MCLCCSLSHTFTKGCAVEESKYYFKAINMRKPSKQPRLSGNPGVVQSSIAETEFRRLLCRCHNELTHHDLNSSNNSSESDSDSSSQSRPGSNMILEHERGWAVRTSLVEIEKLLLDKSNILYGASDETFKHLHGWIILQIGSIPCLLEETQALCRCLDHLYSSFEGFPSILSVQEKREALHAVTGTFWILASSYLERDDRESSQSQATDFAILLRLSGRILGDGTAQEISLEHLQEFLLCMVYLSGKKLIRDHAIDFLQMLCSINCPRTAKVAQIVLTAISSPTSSLMPPWRFDCSDEQEKLFYWKCLAESPATNDPLLHEVLKNKNGIEALTDIAVDRNSENSDQSSTRPDFIAMDAADCISRVAKHRPLFGATRQALIRILLEASCKSVRARAIPGLAACHKEESIWPDLQTTHDMKSIRRIISFLVEPCLVKSDPLSTSQHHTAAEFSIALLADLLEHLTIQQLHQEDSGFPQGVPSLHDIMAIGSVLLDCEKWCVVDRTITMLGNCLRQVGVRLLDECPDLLGTVATFLVSPFSSMTTKTSILVLFNDLARDDSNWHLGMARQPKFLDGLVAMSSSSAWEGADDHGEHQRVALSLLFLLSENTANRRILAKHMGVLGVLIRAVRDLDQNVAARQHTSLGSREEMKSKIMVIAAAL